MENNQLQHHGILGMHWGQRNGPPYPLGASSHSSSEKRAGTKGWSREAKSQIRNRKRYSNSSESNRDKNKGLSNKQKAAIKVGAVAAGVALVAIGGISIYKLNIKNKSKIAKNLALKYDLQLFANRASSKPTFVIKSKKEYATVMSNIRTNITREQKKMKVFFKEIGNYVYEVENNFDDTYRIIGRTRIKNAVTKLYERL